MNLDELRLGGIDHTRRKRRREEAFQNPEQKEKERVVAQARFQDTILCDDKNPDNNDDVDNDDNNDDDYQPGFLDASSHLYKMVCPSVCRSVCPLVHNV